MSGAARHPAATLDPGLDGYSLDAQVGFLLRRASQRHIAIFNAGIPELTPTQFAALAKTAEIGPVSQNELGRATAMDAATIKGVIDRLSARGLIATAASPHDRRRVMVNLTPDGRAALARLIPAARTITEETLAPLTPPERAALLALLGRLG
ncbi:MAG: MarR family transcriptional regulator [Thermohalobaculum sp.]|nr:MarR family transcriptional regulator [Thermohalobaculum sp.]